MIKLKIIASLTIALILSFFGLKYFKNKAETLKKDLKLSKAINESQKSQSDALISSEQEAINELDEAVNSSTEHRNHFE